MNKTTRMTWEWAEEFLQGGGRWSPRFQMIKDRQSEGQGSCDFTTCKLIISFTVKRKFKVIINELKKLNGLVAVVKPFYRANNEY